MGAEPFRRSAAVYPLMYGRKPYAAEAAFVSRLIRARLPAARSALELGCGAGLHARELARRGFRVEGLDRSASMLAAATPARGVRLRRGDARTARLGERFDAVISLFHVFSYLTTEQDLRAALATAAAHLRPGGVLVFDCWHAPAVLASPPRARVARAEDSRLGVTRLSRTRFDPSRLLADVRHDYRVVDKASGRARRFIERHRLRAWSPEELESELRAAGFERMRAFEWLTRRPLGRGTWSACVVARYRGAAARRATVER